MSIGNWPARSAYERARRRRILRGLTRLVRRRAARGLLPLDEATRRLRAFEQRYVGVRPIPLDRIVGTVSRTRDFDREFLPRRRVEERWRRVERAFPEGDFPPIQVYQLGDAYFVVDGHHRVAIARHRGMSHIDAEITLLRSRWPLPPEADLGRIILAEQEGRFMEESGLERARPEARIEFTRPQGYVELLDLIKVHGYHLMRERGEVLPADEVAGDWYDHVYLPGVEAIRREGLGELAPGATEADLFLWVYQRQREMLPERGGLPYEEVARTVREERGRRRLGRASRGRSRRPAG